MTADTDKEVFSSMSETSELNTNGLVLLYAIKYSVALYCLEIFGAAKVLMTE